MRALCVNVCITALVFSVTVVAKAHDQGRDVFDNGEAYLYGDVKSINRKTSTITVYGAIVHADGVVLQTRESRAWQVEYENDTIFTDANGKATPDAVKNGLRVRVYGKINLRDYKIKAVRLDVRDIGRDCQPPTKVDPTIRNIRKFARGSHTANFVGVACSVKARAEKNGDANL